MYSAVPLAGVYFFHSLPFQRNSKAMESTDSTTETRTLETWPVGDTVRWIASGGYVVNQDDVDTGSLARLVASHAVAKALGIVPTVGPRTVIVYNGASWSGRVAAACMDKPPEMAYSRGVKMFKKTSKYVAVGGCDESVEQAYTRVVAAHEEIVGDITRASSGGDTSASLLIIGHSFGKEWNRKLHSVFMGKMAVLGGVRTLAWGLDEEDYSCFDSNFGDAALAYAYSEATKGETPRLVPVHIQYTEQRELCNSFPLPGWQAIECYCEETQPTATSLSHFKTSLEENPEKFLADLVARYSPYSKIYAGIMSNAVKFQTTTGAKYAIVFKDTAYRRVTARKCFDVGFDAIVFVKTMRGPKLGEASTIDNNSTRVLLSFFSPNQHNVSSSPPANSLLLANRAYRVIESTTSTAETYMSGDAFHCEITWIDQGTVSAWSVLRRSIADGENGAATHIEV